MRARRDGARPAENLKMGGSQKFDMPRQVLSFVSPQPALKDDPRRSAQPVTKVELSLHKIQEIDIRLFLRQKSDAIALSNRRKHVRRQNADDREPISALDVSNVPQQDRTIEGRIHRRNLLPSYLAPRPRTRHSNAVKGGRLVLQDA